MAQMKPQVSEWLEKALKLSEQERELLVHGLVESLANDPPNEEAEAAWSKEVNSRVDDIRSGRLKTIPDAQVLARLNARLPDGQQ